MLSWPASAKRESLPPRQCLVPGDWLDGGGGKGIYSMKRKLDLHEMDSLPLAAHCRSAGNDKISMLMHSTRGFSLRFASRTESSIEPRQGSRTPSLWR